MYTRRGQSGLGFPVGLERYVVGDVTSHSGRRDRDIVAVVLCEIPLAAFASVLLTMMSLVEDFVSAFVTVALLVPFVAVLNALLATVVISGTAAVQVGELDDVDDFGLIGQSQAQSPPP